MTARGLPGNSRCSKPLPNNGSAGRHRAAVASHRSTLRT
jgi:hypothetical protein